MDEAAEAADVTIVGAGAAGSVFAAILAEAGLRVVVLERGRARRLSDLYSSQIWARRLKWASPSVVETGMDSVSMNFNAGQGYGGAAIHHYAVWPRMHEDDFRMRSLYGRARDWPFQYSDLRPFYDQVQRDVGLSGDAAKEIWRPQGEAYPLPPVLVTQHGRTLARGFEASGMRTAPLPMAILTQPYDGRPACLWDGWCDAGCPIGALANPLVTYLARAKTAGAVLHANAAVTRVLTDATGRRASGVEYYTEGGARIVQPSAAVVLCAFTVENARILLNSANRQHPQGLANSSGLVGRGLMTHAAVGISGMFSEEMENYLGATGGQLLCQDAFGKSGDPGGAFGSRQWAIAQALKPNDLLGIAMTRPDVFGEQLHGFMRDGARFMGAMVGICEDQPLESNRITLAGQKDALGMPLAQIEYRRSEDAQKLWRTAAAEGLKVFKAAGAADVWHGPPASQHIMGGTPLGADASGSVLNAVSQSHDVDNLFMGGPGVFPTSSAVNSTFTVHAVAMKAARFMAENWSAVKS